MYNMTTDNGKQLDQRQEGKLKQLYLYTYKALDANGCVFDYTPFWQTAVHLEEKPPSLMTQRWRR